MMEENEGNDCFYSAAISVGDLPWTICNSVLARYIKLRSRLYAVINVSSFLLFTYHQLKFVYDLKCYWFLVLFFSMCWKTEFSRLKAVGIFGVHHHIGSRFKDEPLHITGSAGAATHNFELYLMAIVNQYKCRVQWVSSHNSPILNPPWRILKQDDLRS